MDKVKVEDRKRSSGASDDGAPPRKKMAINGGVAKDEHDNQAEEVWVENYTRGAIYRRMHEYKREAATYSARLEELHKRSLYHDDHLRIVDAWWRQLLQEIELIATSTIPSDDAAPADPPYLTGVTFQDSIDFQKHLDERAKAVKSKAEALLQRLAGSRNNIDSNLSELQSRISSLLAAQKDYHVRLDRLNSEKDQLSEQLNTATLRYFKAEKKLDRVKSAQVQKLERQALANDTRRVTPEDDTKASVEPQGDNAELTQKYKEEHAVVTRQQNQIQTILDEIKALQEENSSLKSRREALTDDDFIRSDVFKQFKTKSEELIKQVNHLEATNTQLKEEMEKLSSERTTFKKQLEAEAQALTQELDSDLVARDHDLARLRSARDELLAENTMRKASQDQHHSALEHMKELVGAKDERITALESEVSRLRPGEDSEAAAGDTEMEKLEHGDLLIRHRKLHQDYLAVMTELPAMEKAYRKAMALSHKKVMDFEALEARNGLLTAEKNKADQKYFAARKDADTRNSEIRALRMQNAKSAEVVAQLKEVEAQNRVLLSNLEKQLSDLRQANMTLAGENKRLETAAADASRRLDSAKKEASDLSGLVKTRDSAVAGMRERNLALESESERLQVRMDSLQKDRDAWKLKAESNSSDVEKGLRTLMICSICNENFKNTALKTCGHLFCQKCVESRISNRMRKCPNCSRAFDRMDVMMVHH